MVTTPPTVFNSTSTQSAAPVAASPDGAPAKFPLNGGFLNTFTSAAAVAVCTATGPIAGLFVPVISAKSPGALPLPSALIEQNKPSQPNGNPVGFAVRF